MDAVAGVTGGSQGFRFSGFCKLYNGATCIGMHTTTMACKPPIPFPAVRKISDHPSFHSTYEDPHDVDPRGRLLE